MLDVRPLSMATLLALAAGCGSDEPVGRIYVSLSERDIADGHVLASDLPVHELPVESPVGELGLPYLEVPDRDAEPRVWIESPDGSRSATATVAWDCAPHFAADELVTIQVQVFDFSSESIDLRRNRCMSVDIDARIDPSDPGRIGVAVGAGVVAEGRIDSAVLNGEELEKIQIDDPDGAARPTFHGSLPAWPPSQPLDVSLELGTDAGVLTAALPFPACTEISPLRAISLYAVVRDGVLRFTEPCGCYDGESFSSPSRACWDCDPAEPPCPERNQ